MNTPEYNRRYYQEHKLEQQEKHRTWNKNNPSRAKQRTVYMRSYMNDRHKKFREKRKRELVNLLGGKCVLCGYAKNIAALDFDHIDPSKKCFSISKGLADRSWAAILQELTKCRLLCANCHREITYSHLNNL